MSGELTATNANGLFKRVYDSKVRDLRPKSAVLQKLIEFNEAKKLGESYQMAIALQNPQGITYLGSSGGVSALNNPVSMIYKQATLQGMEINLREQIAYKALSSAVESGEQAFKALTSEVVIAMQNSTSNRVEASLLHGQRGYGTVESVTDNGSNDATIVFTAATWAPGMFWAMGPGSFWDSFTGTSINNTGTLQLTSIQSASRSVHVTYTGTIGSDVAANDVWFPKGAAVTGQASWNEMSGLLAQASNTTGTSLGLSATTYPNWAGNTKSVSGPLGHQVIEEAVAELRDRGAQGAITVLVSSKAYAQLIVELAQVRQLDQSYSTEKAKQGFKSVSYFSPEVDEVQITYHPMMKWGEALLLPVDECERVGSSDITFGVPGMKEQFFQFVPGYNAIELQNYTDQAVALKKPNFSYLLTGITYT